jgi:hypothetical protein
VLIDTTPLPDSIPPVQEIGASSAPLLSASFFIGARCRDYNDDYMQCKTENPGKGELNCLKEGRRVTRCAQSVYVFLLDAHERNPINLREDRSETYMPESWAWKRERGAESACSRME